MSFLTALLDPHSGYKMSIFDTPDTGYMLFSGGVTQEVGPQCEAAWDRLAQGELHSWGAVIAEALGSLRPSLASLLWSSVAKISPLTLPAARTGEIVSFFG